MIASTARDREERWKLKVERGKVKKPLLRGRAGSRFREHPSEAGHEAGAEPGALAGGRADERARRTERQRGDISAERRPLVALQVLLDVRQVERADRGPVRLQVRADPAN